MLAISLLLLGVSVIWIPAAHAQTGSPSGFASIAGQANAARDANRLPEAAALYRKALALRPSWAEGWWSLGTVLYDQNAYADAARAFRRLLSYDPKNGTAHLMLALCEYQLNLDDSALKHLDAAAQFGIQKDEQLKHVLEYHKAMLLLRKGKYESAIETLYLLVYDGVHSDDVDLALGMAVLLMRPAKLPPETSPERQVVLRLGQAESLSLVKNYEEARQRYSALVKEFPDFPNIHYAYGRFLLAAQDTDAAVRQFQEELQKNPTQVRALLQIAAVHYRVDSAAGVPYGEKAVKLAPAYPFGRYLLGLLYLDSGEVARAIPELEAAARLVPQEAQFQFALGTAYAKVGRKADAARARAAFRRLGGDSQAAGGPTTYGERQPLNLDSSSSAGNTGQRPQ
jgi:predicted Zn-dependent protease